MSKSKERAKSLVKELVKRLREKFEAFLSNHDPAMIIIMSVALLHTRLNKPDIDDDNEFEQKYISLMTDDTKARQEFVELYRKKESA